MRKIIVWLFAVLLFFVPIILWPFTSEVFEFNKIVLVYLFTILILAAWLTRCIVERKFILRRTILDLPLLIFLASQVISTLLSIDFYTSVFGYYSRFNGGLISTICYLMLYWAFVSNIDRKHIFFIINSLLISAFLVCIYAVLEHLGIDKSIWVQDVQSRVFSTLGQPNWLAAWVTALSPLAWSLSIKKYEITNSIFETTSKIKNQNSKFLIYLSLSVLFFITLLFTKSRSGLIGFVVADTIFWSLILINKFKEYLLPFIVHNLLFIILALIIGTQWTPSINSLLSNQVTTNQPAPTGTALESGGTESGTIRKIVWQGAIDIWKHYPVVGTGVETYAFSYYMFRPIAHNITSEWDFIYNKAHNQFLNMAANSGSFGLISYLVLIAISIFIFIKQLKLQITNNQLPIITGLLAGFISLSVSNFFGFSVVPTDLEFFLFPALAVALTKNEEVKTKSEETSVQKFIIFFILLPFTFYLLLLTSRYWYADILYSKAKAQNSISRPDLAVPLISKAIRLQPHQSVYYMERCISYSTLAMAFDQNKETTSAAQLSTLTSNDVQKVLSLSPQNVNLRRQVFGIFVRLSTIQEDYLQIARDNLTETIKLAPTDPKLYYNLGIADANLGETQKAINDFKKAIELKPNYIEPRIQYAALLVHLNQNQEAKTELEYILTNLDPKNETAQRALDNLK